MRARLRCYNCDATYDSSSRSRCECGEPLWFDIPTAEFNWAETRKTRGVWRYDALLPATPSNDISVGAGGTPLSRAARLDDYAGSRLFVKNEGQNPTGSFKDRGSAVGIASAADRDIKFVGTVSHGNMAMSMSALAASRGLNCVVFVPERIPSGRLRLISQYDPQLLKVEGDYGRLYYETLSVDVTPNIEFINSDSPLRVAGQKTVGIEICEWFRPDVPDAIILPVSSGGHASAIWKGLRDLADAGVLSEIPSLYLVQAAACDPIAQAYRNQADTVDSVQPGETIAFSIANGSPPSGNRALAAARQTNGAVISVTDEMIREAQTVLASNAGLCVEASSATTLAGVRQLTQKGEIAHDDTVVAITTGTGFKEPSDLPSTPDSTTINLDQLASELSSVVAH